MRKLGIDILKYVSYPQEKKGSTGSLTPPLNIRRSLLKQLLCAYIYISEKNLNGGYPIKLVIYHSQNERLYLAQTDHKHGLENPYLMQSLSYATHNNSTQ